MAELNCPNCRSTRTRRLYSDGSPLWVCQNCGHGQSHEWVIPGTDTRGQNKGQGNDPYQSGYNDRQKDPNNTEDAMGAIQMIASAMGASGMGDTGAAALGHHGTGADGLKEHMAHHHTTHQGGHGGGGQKGGKGGPHGKGSRSGRKASSGSRTKRFVKKLAVIVGSLAVMWLTVLLVMFGTIGFFTVKLLDVPFLQPAAGALSKIACLGGHGSETACEINEILGAFGDSGAEDALRKVWDCSNLRPDEDRETCDGNAIAQMEGAAAIPANKRWMIEVYMKASSHYDVPWELIAAVHGANTNLGADGNCEGSRGGGGQYDFNKSTWEKYKVDAGEEYHDEEDGCWQHTPEEKEVEGPNGEDVKVKKHVKYRDKPDDDPGVIADEDPRDMVDATFTQARILKDKGARGALTWDYQGDPPNGCEPNESLDGKLWAPPVLASAGYSYVSGGGGGTLTGGDSTAFDDIIIAKANKYNIPAPLIKGIIAQESNFNPNAVSPAGARGLMQFMPDTWTGLGRSMSEIHNPEINIDTGARYISDQLKYFRGNLTLSLAAYNGGPTGAVGGNGTPPSSYLRQARGGENWNYAHHVPARIMKYGGWGDTIHLDPRYVDADFEKFQREELGKVEIPAGSLTMENQPRPNRNFGMSGSGGGSVDLVAGGGAESGSGGATVVTPARPWESTTGPYNGAKADDRVSASIRYRTGDDHTECYIAIVNEWYKVLTGVTTGDAAMEGGCKQSPVRDAIRAKAQEMGLRHTSGDRSPDRNSGAGGVSNSYHLSTRCEVWADDYVGPKEEELLTWIKATYKAKQGAGGDYEDAMRHDVGSGMHLHVEGWAPNPYGAIGGGAGVQGIIQAAELQMGTRGGIMHYCAVGIRCDYGGPNPPRSIPAYNQLGMNRNVPPKGNARWDCSSFVGYVMWVGAKINVISQGGNTNGIWATMNGNVLHFESGYGTPPGGLKPGDVIWFGISRHIEIVKDANHSYGWGSEPGKVHTIQNGSVAGLGSITNWARAKNLNAVGSTDDPNAND